jgi:tRNA(Ile)-lysidine synthetase, N-terminal domain/tRNA(Ile)-lysidine synthetase, C-terminal domain
VALAHHQDDQVETVLYRIIRGTGLDGLSGIPVIRDGFYIRPLLEVSRKEIAEYADFHKLKWLEDSSNHKLVYTRNKIRLQLLPLLEQSYNPRVKDSILRLAKLAQEQRDFLADVVIRKLAEISVREEDGTGLKRMGIKLDIFLEQPPYLQYCLLKRLLLTMNPDCHLETAALDRLLLKINEEKYAFKMVHIFKRIAVCREADLLFFTPPGECLFHKKETYTLTAPGENIIAALNLQIKIEPAISPADWSAVADNEAYIMPAKLSLPLKLRFWEPGDVFKPLGGPGFQKLHDFFINKKISRAVRTDVPLLVTADNRIVWVIGYRLSDEFKVGAEETAIWRITAQFSK